MFTSVLRVLYNCLIISVIHTLHHASKIVVSLFHTFIAAPSRKIIPELDLQGTYLMIWGRYTTNNNSTRHHNILRMQPRATALGQLFQ
jgi:hypothetical protein